MLNGTTAGLTQQLYILRISCNCQKSNFKSRLSENLHARVNITLFFDTIRLDNPTIYAYFMFLISFLMTFKMIYI